MVSRFRTGSWDACRQPNTTHFNPKTSARIVRFEPVLQDGMNASGLTGTAYEKWLLRPGPFCPRVQDVLYVYVRRLVQTGQAQLRGRSMQVHTLTKLAGLPMLTGSSQAYAMCPRSWTGPFI